MKFDFIIGNPPYLKGLHFKISVKAFKNVKDNGQFIFVQPSIAYHNKTTKAIDMYLDIIKKFHTEVEIIRTGIFSAKFTADLAVTKITKTPSPEEIQKVTYKNGKVYHDVGLEKISFTQIPPDVYISISDKIKKFIYDSGSINHMISRDGGTGIKISSLCGSFDSKQGEPKPSFFSFYSPPNYKENWGNHKDGFVFLCEEAEAENIYDYLSLKMPLMGLLLKKYSLQTFGFKLVPWVDFSKKYTDEELFDMVGFTEKEVKAIKKAIPNYNARF